MAGKLVDREEFMQLVMKNISEAKTRLLAVPSKAKARVPTLTPADIVALDDLIREALEDIANGAD
jgi:phage terminase Nu1 subunit (DNA packaging protein)